MRICKRLVLILSTFSATCAFGANHTVQVGQNNLGQTASAFNPSSLSIAAGDTVTFVNNSGGFHDAMSNDGGTAFNSGSASTSWTYTTPPITSSIGYHCTIHGSLSGSSCSGMCGTITVTVPVRLQSFEVD